MYKDGGACEFDDLAQFVDLRTTNQRCNNGQVVVMKMMRCHCFQVNLAKFQNLLNRLFYNFTNRLDDQGAVL